MQVKEIMSEDVDTLLPDTPVATVARLVGEKAITDVPHMIERAEAAEP